MHLGSPGDPPEAAQHDSREGVAWSMDDSMSQVDEADFGLGTLERIRPPAPDVLVIDAFERHQAELNAFAIQLTRDPDAAADLVQEAFLRLIDEVQAGRAPDNARAWLYRVVANLTTSRGRKASVATRWQSALARRDTAEGPETGFLEREASGEVRALLAGVSRDERTALLLSAHGFAGAEIAAVLGRTHLATRALLCRARARLRDDAVAMEAAR